MSKVLVVEDDPIEKRMYINLFTREGFEVESAENGEEGIAKALANKPDIILLDVMMSRMNGFVALDIIKSKAELKDTPIVMLTNLSGEENRAEALQKGAAAYIIKSNVDNKKLVATVRDIIQAFSRAQTPKE